MKNLKDMLNESRRGIDKDIEKKAKDIAIEIEKSSSFLSGFGKEEIVIEELQNAALEMAEWMKSYMIEKSRLWLEGNAEKYAGTTTSGDGYMEDDFYKDFCEAMKK